MREIITLDIFNDKNQALEPKKFYTNEGRKNIGQWIASFRVKNPNPNLAMLDSGRLTFQHQNLVRFENIITDKAHALTLTLTLTNLIPCCIFFAVRHAIPASWLNDRDQFLCPNDAWQKDKEFQHDCLAFALFHRQNRIVSQEDGTNHFIPFSSSEIKAKASFKSNFMWEFLRGKIELPKDKPIVKDPTSDSLDGLKQYSKDKVVELYFDFSPNEKLKFSKEAQAVFDAGKELFSYYHGLDEDRFFATPYNVNASLYEIKEFFQGRSEKGKMNPPAKCKDEIYKELITELNNCLLDLAKEKIKDKIYDYGFLRE